ncbi:CPBP family intramembrane glutamic endopeptidase [Sphingobacterium siyangense]|uniref:CPBP family intramembrane glutamic endopeptidase n=1 Tax=Sphingobacterium siyangense TaxID=459529 RepID=UPI003DA5E380
MNNKIQKNIKEILSVAFLILFPHFFPLPFYSYTIICFLCTWIVLKKEGITFNSLGFSKKNLTIYALAIGSVSALVWICFMQFLYIPVIKNLFTVPDYTEYNFIRNSFSTLIMTLIAAWLVGGLYEEIVFRGFIQNLLEKGLFKAYKVYWSIVVTSILFALYHWQQDVFGVIAALLGGLYWGFFIGFLEKTFGYLFYPMLYLIR